jgi:hypothetical protein
VRITSCPFTGQIKDCAAEEMEMNSLDLTQSLKKKILNRLEISFKEVN